MKKICVQCLLVIEFLAIYSCKCNLVIVKWLGTLFHAFLQFISENCLHLFLHAAGNGSDLLDFLELSI